MKILRTTDRWQHNFIPLVVLAGNDHDGFYGRPLTPYRLAEGSDCGQPVSDAAMMVWPLVFLIVLLILSALFSSVETAFTSLSLGQISVMEKNGGKRGRLLKRLSERPDVVLTTLLIGNNLANLGASALTTAMTIRLFGNAYIAAATGVLTLTVLVFCEVSPKQIALLMNESLCLRSARVVWALSMILRPIIWVVTAISRTVTRIFAGVDRPVLTLESLLHQVKAAEGLGVVESFEEEMVRNVFRINDRAVEAIMTHRTDLVSLEENMTIRESLNVLLESHYSWAPVLKKDHEHVRGVVSLAQLAREVESAPEQRVIDAAIEPYLIPGTMKAHELLFQMRRKPAPMAIVLDEYGGIDGVVTQTDIIEEIFGELSGNLEPEQNDPITPGGQGTWIIQGDADFYDVADMLGLELEHGSRTHTIGGYLLEKLGSIPSVGSRINLPEGSYVVLEYHRKRITRVRFYPNEDSSD